MSAIRKIGNFLGLTDENYVYEDEVIAEPAAPIRDRQAERQERASRRERRAEVVAINESVEIAPPVIARNITLAPESFNDARQIGEEFRGGATVVVNLQALDIDTTRRLVDYMAGLVHGIDGKFTKIAMNVFMLAPRNVEVRDEAGLEVKNDGFFNHS